MTVIAIATLIIIASAAVLAFDLGLHRLGHDEIDHRLHDIYDRAT